MIVVSAMKCVQVYDTSIRVCDDSYYYSVFSEMAREN